LHFLIVSFIFKLRKKIDELMKAALKTILLPAVVVMAMFTAVTYTSCNSDKCKAIVCAYGGVCKDGACICAAGYEGTQCEIITRERYKGAWNVSEKGTYTDAAQYVLAIDNSGTDMTKMIIRGFSNTIAGDVNMRINSDEITIPLQTIDSYEIQGTGVLKSEGMYAKHGQLTVRYTIKDLRNNMVNDFGVNPGSQASVWTK
jgi:uncharacterized membrane protein